MNDNKKILSFPSPPRKQTKHGDTEGIIQENTKNRVSLSIPLNFKSFFHWHTEQIKYFKVKSLFIYFLLVWFTLLTNLTVKLTELISFFSWGFGSLPHSEMTIYNMLRFEGCSSFEKRLSGVSVKKKKKSVCFCMERICSSCTKSIWK